MTSSALVRIDLSGSRGYDYVLRPLTELGKALIESGLNGRRCIMVTDLNVGALYADTVADAISSEGFNLRTITLPPGERTKSDRYLHEIYDVALHWRIDRDTIVVALGGGVIGDVAGYAAATLLRGLPLIHVPTSLLAQVDSSIGGKTGINHSVGKNLIGAIHQPEFVLADPSTLISLPDIEWASGLSEVVKHAMIDDHGLMEWLSPRMDALLHPGAEETPELLIRTVATKARIVSTDEREAGRRAFLNLGHTFGHALEHALGYGAITHGQAVRLGLFGALKISERRHPNADLSAAYDLLSALPPGRLPDLPDLPALLEAMQRDKKTRSGVLRFVLLRDVGTPYVASDVTDEELHAAWECIVTSTVTS